MNVPKLIPAICPPVNPVKRENGNKHKRYHHGINMLTHNVNNLSLRGLQQQHTHMDNFTSSEPTVPTDRPNWQTKTDHSNQDGALRSFPGKGWLLWTRLLPLALVGNRRTPHENVQWCQACSLAFILYYTENLDV